MGPAEGPACGNVSRKVYPSRAGHGARNVRYLRHMVHNLHEREIAAPASEVGMLIDSLASKSDRLWPRNEWPAGVWMDRFAWAQLEDMGPCAIS